MKRENIETFAVRKEELDFVNLIPKLRPYINKIDPNIHIGDRLIRCVTIQVTEACNLKCSYCYQINKSPAVLSFEDAKKFIDILLEGPSEKNTLITKETTDGIILDFIGGEPTLEVQLMSDIVDYFVKRCIELDHPWQYNYRISVGTNGTRYFEPDFQKFIKDNEGRLSISITVDGDKELHDSCRVFADGSGSYDLAAAAVLDWNKQLGDAPKSTKLTIAPENLKYLKSAIIHMIDLGFNHINENCVYEDVWNTELATQLYYELKGIADYFIEHDLDQKVSLRIFDASLYGPISCEENKNWCGGDGNMLAVDVHGDIFNCIRYMASSLGNDQPPLAIGNVNDGIQVQELHKDNYECMHCITRRSQSTDKCFYCPCGSGCGWCSGYNYQKFGTPNKRATFICQMHQASALANTYYWNKVLKKNCITDDNQELTVPSDWAIEIIGKEEYDMLVELSGSEPFTSEEWYSKFGVTNIE